VTFPRPFIFFSENPAHRCRRLHRDGGCDLAQDPHLGQGEGAGLGNNEGLGPLQPGNEVGRVGEVKGGGEEAGRVVDLTGIGGEG
jgi:hypothetical protein